MAVAARPAARRGDFEASWCLTGDWTVSIHDLRFAGERPATGVISPLTAALTTSTLLPDSLTICCANSRSSRMKRANSSSRSAAGSTPRSVYMRLRNAGSAMMRSTSRAIFSTIGRGTPAWVNRPNQVVGKSSPGAPASASARRETAASANCATTASGVMRPLWSCGTMLDSASTAIGVVPPSTALTTSPPPRYGTFTMSVPSALFSLSMKHRGRKREGRVAELAGLRLGHRDHLGEGLDLGVAVDDHRERVEEQVRDRLQVLLRIVGNGLEQELVVDGGLARHHADGVAVGRGFHAGARADVLAAAGTVLHHDRLVPGLLQFIGERAGEHVAAAAGRQRKHDPHRPRRIILRRGGAARRPQARRSASAKSASMTRISMRPQPSLRLDAGFLGDPARRTRGCRR